MLMTSFRPQTFDSFFSDRFASDAARSSAATASTPCAISSASARLRRKTAGEKIGVAATRDSLMGPITLARCPLRAHRPPWTRGGERCGPAPSGGFPPTGPREKAQEPPTTHTPFSRRGKEEAPLSRTGGTLSGRTWVQTPPSPPPPTVYGRPPLPGGGGRPGGRGHGESLNRRRAERDSNADRWSSARRTACRAYRRTD